MSDETPSDTSQTDESATFSEAMQELEGILNRLDEDSVDVDRLAKELRRATQLLEVCRGKIRKAEDEVTQIVQSLDED